MKKLFTLAFGILTLSAVAQTNRIYFDIGDLGLAPQGNVQITVTPKFTAAIRDGIFLRNDPIAHKTVLTNGTARAWFTNLVWGNYSANVQGVSGTPYTFTVTTNTLGVVNAATLSPLETNAPNTTNFFYNAGEVDALLAALPSSSNIVATLSNHVASTYATSAQLNAKFDSANGSGSNPIFSGAIVNPYIDGNGPVTNYIGTGLDVDGNGASPNYAASLAGGRYTFTTDGAPSDNHAENNVVRSGDMATYVDSVAFAKESGIGNNPTFNGTISILGVDGQPNYIGSGLDVDGNPASPAYAASIAGGLYTFTSDGSSSDSHDENNVMRRADVAGEVSALRDLIDEKLDPDGDGSQLTDLNATQLTSGTVPLARLPSAVLTNNQVGATSFKPSLTNAINFTVNGVLVSNGVGQVTISNGIVTAISFTGSAAGLTSLPAGQLTGSIADARLSSNVPLKDGANTFTGTNTFTQNNAAPVIVSSASATSGYGSISGDPAIWSGGTVALRISGSVSVLGPLGIASATASTPVNQFNNISSGVSISKAGSASLLTNFFARSFSSTNGAYYPSNTFNFNVTNDISDKGYWIGNSNGCLVCATLTNGVVVWKTLAP